MPRSPSAAVRAPRSATSRWIACRSAWPQSASTPWWWTACITSRAAGCAATSAWARATCGAWRSGAPRCAARDRCRAAPEQSRSRERRACSSSKTSRRAIWPMTRSSRIRSTASACGAARFTTTAATPGTTARTGRASASCPCRRLSPSCSKTTTSRPTARAASRPICCAAAWRPAPLSTRPEPTAWSSPAPRTITDATETDGVDLTGPPGADCFALVADTVTGLENYWVSTFQLDTLRIDSTRVTGTQIGFVDGFTRLTVTRSQFLGAIGNNEILDAIGNDTSFGGARVDMDSVTMQGAASCDECIDGLRTARAIANVSHFAGDNLYTALGLSDSSGTVVHSTFTHTAYGVYATGPSFGGVTSAPTRSAEHTSELQSHCYTS